MDIYHISKYLVMFSREIYQVFEEKFVSSNDQLGKGHNSQLIVFTDYNLLLGVHWLQSSIQGRGTGRDLLHCMSLMDSQAVE